MVDKNEFYREASLRICSSLKIENALCSCLQYLKTVMPADMLFLQRLEPELGAMRTIAKATVEEGSELDELTALTQESLENARSIKPTELPDSFIFNKPELNPIARDMFKSHDIQSSSVLLLFLHSEGKHLGSLVLLAYGEDRFNDDHAQLLLMLKEPACIAMANVLKHREVVRLKNILADDNRYLHRELSRHAGEDIVGGDFGLRDVMEKVRQVAPLDSPVLLLGETGVGKDVIANAIHNSSPRRNQSFIPVNCGAIPGSLLDSELFGHEKGSFTGAINKKRGKFERADKGTIFLDEIGELSPEAQVRMLRVLENREIERVGGSDSIRVDLRVIAATNRDLEKRIAAEMFREDLWFRLNIFPIVIPPLRARKEDIPALTHHFVEKKTVELKLTFQPEIAPGEMDKLISYHWPGNVRELENIVERAIILYKTGPLHFDVTTRDSNGDVASSNSAGPASQPESSTLDEVTTRHIEGVLKYTRGKIHGPDGAAELLGINASTLRNKMNKLGIRYKRRDNTSAS